MVVDSALDDAMTELCAYVLALEAQHERLRAALLGEGAERPSAPARASLERLAGEIGVELDALRALIDALYLERRAPP